MRGDKSISIGNISSLPISISSARTNVERLENIEKFSAGPTLEKPGPMLFRAEATAVKFVSKSKLSILIIKIDNATIRGMPPYKR